MLYHFKAVVKEVGINEKIFVKSLYFITKHLYYNLKIIKLYY